MTLHLPAIRLTVLLCLGAPRCAVPLPQHFHTWAECGKVGASMLAGARKVALGVVGFTCNSMGGTGR